MDPLQTVLAPGPAGSPVYTQTLGVSLSILFILFVLNTHLFSLSMCPHTLYTIAHTQRSEKTLEVTSPLLPHEPWGTEHTPSSLVASTCAHWASPWPHHSTPTIKTTQFLISHTHIGSISVPWGGHQNVQNFHKCILKPNWKKSKLKEMIYNPPSRQQKCFQIETLSLSLQKAVHSAYAGMVGTNWGAPNRHLAISLQEKTHPPSDTARCLEELPYWYCCRLRDNIVRATLLNNN